MKIVAMIARYLLGLGFLVFGLNGFFHFIPQPPKPNGPAKDYIMALVSTGYMMPVFAIEVAAALMLLANRYVALGVTLLGPIMVNILLFHGSMEHTGLPMALFFVVLWFLVFYSVRSAFAGIFQSQVEA